MSSINSTNGASLEDCHTNFFVLADLSGLKWRRLRPHDHHHSSHHLASSSGASKNDPLEDPVLSSYSKCLSAGELLCAWTRVENQGSDGNRSASLSESTAESNRTTSFTKELWIFWYSSEPDLNEYLSKDLHEVEQGSWENGLSYESRTLLFKAFHNLIERNLLSKGFARFGRWFTQPQVMPVSSSSPSKRSSEHHPSSSFRPSPPSSSSSESSTTSSSTQLSFSFDFFIHGDSSICASVDIRQLPAVFTMNKGLLQTAIQVSSSSSSGQQTQQASSSFKGVPVILSPYGLSGTLTGQSFKDNDPSVQKFLSDWKKFYPLTVSMNKDSSSSSGNSSSSGSSSTSSSNKAHHNHPASSSLFDSSPASDAKVTCPSVVEVIVAGVRMKYPSSYTFHVPSSDSTLIGIECPDKSLSTSSSTDNNQLIPGRQLPLDAFLTPPNSPDEVTQVRLKTPLMSPRQPSKPSVTNLVRSTVEMDVSLRVKFTEKTDAETSVMESKVVDLSQDFQDPCHRPACCCHRCKSPKKSNTFASNNLSNNNSNSSLKSGKEVSPKNKDKSKSNPVVSGNKPVSSQPFHKRNQCPASLVSSTDSKDDSKLMLTPGPLSQQPQQQPKTPMSVLQPMSYKSPGPLLSSIQSNVSSAAGVDSPRSVAPSSVMNGDVDPSSVGPSGSIGLPSVSPAPAQDVFNANESSSFASSSISQSPAMTAMTPVAKEKSQLEQLLSPYPASNSPRLGSLYASLQDRGTPLASASNSTSVPVVDELESRRAVTNSGLLYDMHSLSDDLNDWGLPHPKRRRLVPKNEEDTAVFSVGNNSHHRDPYEFSEFDETDISGQKIEDSSLDNKTNGLLTPEEVPRLQSSWSNSFTGQQNPILETSKLLMNGMESLTASSPLTPQQFTRQEELVAAVSDLDHIFEQSSGDESSDGDHKTNHLSNNRNGSTSSLPTVQELTKMFPTPPSLEPTIASPSTSALEAALLMAENPDAPCSPEYLENAWDSNEVYKVNILAKIIAPKSYAPVTDLPAPTIIPVDCRYKANPKEQKGQQRVVQQQQSSQQLPPPVAPQNQLAKMLGHQQPSLGPQGYQHQQPSFSMMSSSMISGGRMMSASTASYPSLSRGPPNVQIRSPGGPFTPPMAVSSPLQGALTSGVMSPYASGPGRGRSHVVNGFPEGMTDSRFSSSSLTKSSSMIMEVCSVIVNLSLSDSILNLHKDHNFDSCTICVCNMNIKGSDAGLFLPESLIPGVDEPQYKCTCGFSAVVNRRKSQFAGLFYEDEVEVTGHFYEPLQVYRKRRGLPPESKTHGLLGPLTPGELNPVASSLLELLRGQSSYSISSSSFFFKALYTELMHRYRRTKGIQALPSNTPSKLQSISLDLEPGSIVRSDFCEIALLTLTHGKSILESFPRVPASVLRSEARKVLKKSCLHEWQFLESSPPDNSHDAVRFLRSLQLILQESVQKKPKATSPWEVTYSVSGPLTWRQFHRLAGRGTEDQCEPQPIPSLLIGYNKEWVAVAPYALKMWNQLLLEPYSTTRDVAYVVICPDNSVPETTDKSGKISKAIDGHLGPRVRTFFKELSTMYEVMRLGKHAPLSKNIPLLRVGKKSSVKLADEQIRDEWFTNSSHSPDIISKLKAYLQVCTAYLIPLIMDQSKANFSDFAQANKTSSSGSSTAYASSSGNSSSTFSSSTVSSSGQSRPQGSSPAVSANDSSESSSKNNEEEKSGGDGSGGQSYFSSYSEFDCEEDGNRKQPAIVIYIVEPFNFASLDREGYRVACAGLLRCFAEVFKSLPDLQHNLNLQLISLDAVLGTGLDAVNSTRQEQLRSLSLSVYGQCRKTMSPVSLCKSLTGFGPSASLESFLKKMKENKGSISSLDLGHTNKYFCPPFILAPLKDKQAELGEMFGERREKSQILYCSYCLTEDQRFLVASVSNEKGDLMENTVIYIEVPNRLKRKGASVRKFGLNKLMEFLVQVMSESLEPWRLVIGRLGRLGQGELREWAALLSKKALIKQTARLKEKCEQCRALNYFELPSILSACLISLEADTCLRVFPDQFTHEDRFKGSSCPLDTPADASSTHLLIFPTSATIASSQGSFPNDGTNLGDDDLLGALVGDGDDLGVDDGMNDLFNWNDDLPSPGLGQGNEQPGIGSNADSPSARQTGFDGTGFKDSSGLNDLSDEPLQLLQQPLALGYYVSTAQTGPLPSWFWSSCPHLQDVTPVFLKAALLIHTPTVHSHTDDLLHQNNKNGHPLDSHLTTDVLRYVLEGYNALSWLSLDPSSHDRSSCLPIHIQMMMQLYSTIQALT